MSICCSLCDYKTNINSNYNKHLKTQKHQRKMEESILKMEKSIVKMEKSIQNDPLVEYQIDNSNKLECLWCRRLFCRNDTLKKHKMVCKNKMAPNSSQNAPKSSQMLSIAEPDDSINNIVHQCQYCQIICSKKSNLQRHLKKCKKKDIFILNENIQFDLKEIEENTHNIFREPKKMEKSIQKKKIEEKKDLKSLFLRSDLKYPEVTQNVEKSMNVIKCQFCQQIYGNNRSLNKHLRSCLLKNNQIDKLKKDLEDKEIELQKLNYDKDIEIEKLKKEKDLEIEKLEAINQEKDRRIEDKDKTIEIAKQSNSITINNTSNKTINYLNNNFGEMIAMEQFLNSLEHTHQLTLQERKDLLTAYQECGIDVFARNFSYIMKQNCKRQLEAQGLTDMKLIPLFCSDGNLRSHKEKQSDGWKTLYDNQSINRMINISNQQIHDSYQTLVPVNGRERNKVFNEIKKDNHQNKLKLLEDKDN